jgi:hypothetical protein
MTNGRHLVEKKKDGEEEPLVHGRTAENDGGQNRLEVMLRINKLIAEVREHGFGPPY